ncbi:MAG: penicillin-binding transpeptidase domain-containing protein, partial [Betaproteobacteria bacterium]
MSALPLAVYAAVSTKTAPPIERPDWSRFFSDADAIGSIVIADERAGPSPMLGYRLDRSRHRYTPASTFKIPHSLFALDAGLIKDEFQV